MPYIIDQKQKEWLINLISKESRHTIYKSIIEEEGKSLFDLMCNELSSCQLSMAELLHIIPFIQPRYYTISSSSSVYPGTVHITISITEKEMKTKKFVGLTSGYLYTRQGKGDANNVRVFVRPSSFRLPKKLTTPIVMIGPGTGLAPMRALLQEREYQAKKQRLAQGDCRNVLYFGCKYKNVDYIYADELHMFQEKGVLSELKTAFSRDERKKVYVQHLMKIKDNASSLMQNIDEHGAYIYVCGATAMGQDVMDSFIEIIKEYKNISNSDAVDYIKALQNNGRYVQELWTA